MIELLQKCSLCDDTSGKCFYPDDIVFPYSHRHPLEYENESSKISLIPVQRLNLRDQLQNLLNDSSNKEIDSEPLFENLSSPCRSDTISSSDEKQ